MKPGLDWSAPAARDWLKFLITVHEDGDELEYGQMVTWLADVDGWSTHDAVRLFEVSDGVLNALFEYHRFRGPLRDPDEPDGATMASVAAGLA